QRRSPRPIHRRSQPPAREHGFAGARPARGPQIPLAELRGGADFLDMPEAFTATAIAQPLDDYLREVVQTLHTAVNQGMRRAADDPKAATPQIADCEEIISVIMAGDVKDWVG